MMTKMETIAWIQRSKIVPVIRAASPAIAMRVVESLLKGGIDILEITMTVPGAVDLIRDINDEFRESVLIGAGTVYDATTAEKCVEAGAQFIVGPCIDQPTIHYCRHTDVVVAPGCLTPTEIAMAWDAGADIIKVFPCDALGGPSYIKSLKAPFPNISFMPTGGVSLDNVLAFLKAGAIAVGVGNSLVDPALILEDRYDEIVNRAIAFRSAVTQDN